MRRLPAYVRPLASTDERCAREVLAETSGMVVGPVGGPAVVRVEGVGEVLRLFDAYGQHRATFASWPAADAAILAVVAEREAVR